MRKIELLAVRFDECREKQKRKFLVLELMVN